MAHPWSQRESESGAAYAAFSHFRDMGPTRSSREAYRQHTGKPGASQAAGWWNRWVKDHAWHERARAWDAHLAAERQKGVDKAAERQGRKWAQLRDAVLNEGVDRWYKRLKLSDAVANMPLVQQTVERDGKRITVEPAAVLDQLRAVTMAVRSQAALLELIDRGLDIERTAIEQQAAQAPAGPTVHMEPGWDARYQAWLAHQRQQILSIRRTDPRGDAAPRPEPPTPPPYTPEPQEPPPVTNGTIGRGRRR